MTPESRREFERLATDVEKEREDWDGTTGTVIEIKSPIDGVPDYHRYKVKIPGTKGTKFYPDINPELFIYERDMELKPQIQLPEVDLGGGKRRSKSRNKPKKSAKRTKTAKRTKSRKIRRRHK
jgi:hypothetical protein